MGEALNEPGVDGKGLIVRGRHWLVVAPNAVAPPLYKALHQRGLSLPNTVVAYAGLGGATPVQWLAANKGSASLLAAPLPLNVHLVTTHVYNATTVLLRLAHIYDAGEDATWSKDATVSLAGLFSPTSSIKKVVAAEEMTMQGALPLTAVVPSTYTTETGAPITLPVVPPAPSGAGLDVTLSAQQIRTFMLTVE